MDGKVPPVQVSCASFGKLLFWWQQEVGCHPQPDPIPAPASLGGHLPDRVAEKLEAFWLALGWHHRHQMFLVGLKLHLPPWGRLVLNPSLKPLKRERVVIGIFKMNRIE